jgi:hypothetical protein
MSCSYTNLSAPSPPGCPYPPLDLHSSWQSQCDAFSGVPVPLQTLLDTANHRSTFNHKDTDQSHVPYTLIHTYTLRPHTSRHTYTVINTGIQWSTSYWSTHGVLSFILSPSLICAFLYLLRYLWKPFSLCQRECMAGERSASLGRSRAKAQRYVCEADLVLSSNCDPCCCH